jgi:MFS family permease
VAFSGLATTMTVFGQTPGVSVFVDPVARDLGLSRPEISALYSVASLGAALLVPLVGRWIDRHGVRRAGAVIGAAFGLVVLALSGAQSAAWLLAGFLGIRLLGQGALSLVARTIVAIRFRAGLGLAVGVSGALGAMGVSLTPLLLSGAIDAVGWRATWVLGAVALWLVVIPLSLGMLRPGEDRPVAPDRAVDAPDPPADWTRAQALRTPFFWLVTLAGAAVAMVLTGLSFHQISILGEAGLPPALAAAMFVPLTVASVAAIALVGPLSDRVAPRRMLAASMALLALPIVLLPALEQPWLPLVYALAMGGALGASQALEGTLYPRHFGIAAIATIRGMAFSVMAAGAALGPVLVGLVRDVSGGYAALAPLLLGVPIAIGAAALVVPLPRRGASG